MKKLNFVDRPGGFLLFCFALLLGRFPLWLLLLLVYTGAPHMNIKAFLFFVCAAILAKGLLFAHENDKSIAAGIFCSLWLRIIKPLGLITIIYMGTIGVMLAFPYGAKSAQIMSLALLALLIGLGIIYCTQKKPARKVLPTLLERDGALHLTLTLMWIYVFFPRTGHCLQP